MTADRIRCILANLPDGDSEIYLHPAAGRDAVLDHLMPNYEHEAELVALLQTDIRTLSRTHAAELYTRG